MFDLSKPEKITRLSTRNGDEWSPMPGTLKVHKTVLRFGTAEGQDIQVHVAEISSVVSLGSRAADAKRRADAQAPIGSK